MPPVILASASPRRRELLHYITDDFRCVCSQAEEKVRLPEGLDCRQIPAELAKLKARDIAGQYAGCLVIGADTVVIGPGGDVLGKPRDKADAVRMLEELSGAVHHVVTGVCLVMGDQERTFSEVTKVEFYPLSHEEILSYVDSGQPMDKAGAYGIQDKGALLVKRIEGDYYNVMGLPVARLSRELKAMVNLEKNGD